LCIGNYGTQKKLLLNTASQFKEILFIIINGKWEIHSKDNILFFKRVSEKELLEIYTISDFLYRPLKFSSANNSILEGLSMGVFIITNDTGGIKNYLNNKNSKILFSNKILKSILESNLKKEKINAMKFDWKNINSRIIPLYEDVLKNEQK